jgi:hypothetical protein
MTRRHSNVPLRKTATGEGFALRAGAKDLRAQFDAWRARFERENARLREINAGLLEAAQLVDDAFSLDDISAFTTEQQQAIGAVAVAIEKAAKP